MTNQETGDQEVADSEVTTKKATTEESQAEEQASKKAEEAPKAPEPMATSDEKVAILKHDIYRKGCDDTTEAVSIELTVKNVSDKLVGSALFEAELYDIDGHVLEKVTQKTIELEPDRNRKVRINYSQPNSDRVRNYWVKVARTSVPSESSAIGNELLVVLNHNVHITEVDDDFRTSDYGDGVHLAIRNISKYTIATAVFEAVFYDIEGNLFDKVRHEEICLLPNTSRSIIINTQKSTNSKLGSYDVKLVRVTTADLEKIQLRRHERKAINDGREEVSGFVKNISEVKTDTAIVANFYDSNKENIGTKVVIIRDIEPGSLQSFRFMFKPQQGDMVRTYDLNIGEIVESDG